MSSVLVAVLTYKRKNIRDKNSEFGPLAVGFLITLLQYFMVWNDLEFFGDKKEPLNSHYT